MIILREKRYAVMNTSGWEMERYTMANGKTGVRRVKAPNTPKQTFGQPGSNSFIATGGGVENILPGATSTTGARQSLVDRTAAANKQAMADNAKRIDHVKLAAGNAQIKGDLSQKAKTNIALAEIAPGPKLTTKQIMDNTAKSAKQQGFKAGMDQGVKAGMDQGVKSVSGYNGLKQWGTNTWNGLSNNQKLGMKVAGGAAVIGLTALAAKKLKDKVSNKDKE